MRFPAELLAVSLILGGCGGCAVKPTAPAQFGAPESLVASCTAEYSGVPATNGELLAWGLAQKRALDECNDDKTALREWNKLIKR